jgi:hypothetical protein
MPYDIRKRGSKFCVIKREGGRTMGCHTTKAKAERQRRALYASEASADGGESMATVKTRKPSVSARQAAEAVLALAVAAEEARESWSGVLGTIMSPTSDGRIIEADVDYRDLPVPFSVQEKKAMGHDGAEVCGRIETIEFIPLSEFEKGEEFDIDEVHEDAFIVWGTGSLDGSDASDLAKRLLDNGAGVSVDGLHFSGKLWNREDMTEVDTSDLDFEEIFEKVMTGEFLQGLTGKIAGVTVVDVPAFEEATVMLATAAAQLRFGVPTLTASAAGLAPLEPPKAWFEVEEPDEPTPLTITDDGQVFGHLALWDQCHPAFASCERPPRSLSDYGYFHVGQLKTKEGRLVNVGRITVGESGRATGGHASIVLGRQGAMEHYDKTGCVAAFVCAKDGRHGIWMSGAVRSDAPAERVRDMRANPPSGDWRDYELVAVLSVPVAGFPIPRVAEAHLVASAAGMESVATLIATAHTEPIFGEDILDGDEIVGHVVTGWTFPCNDEPVDIPTYRARMQELSERRKKALGVWTYLGPEDDDRLWARNETR